MLRADAGCAVPAHGVTNQTAAQTVWNRSVMSVDVCNQIVRNKPLEISGSDRARIHRPVVHRLRIGHHDDHLLGALGESTFYGLRNMDFVGPLFGADGITV